MFGWVGGGFGFGEEFRWRESGVCVRKSVLGWVLHGVEGLVGGWSLDWRGLFSDALLLLFLIDLDHCWFYCCWLLTSICFYFHLFASDLI